MNIRGNKQIYKFYAWTAAAYALMWFIIDHANLPEPFWPRAVNNLWFTIYLAAINFRFFEYTLPFLKRKRNIIATVLLSLLVICALLMLFSFGLYTWRAIGISLHVYTAL